MFHLFDVDKIILLVRADPLVQTIPAKPASFRGESWSHESGRSFALDRSRRGPIFSESSTKRPMKWILTYSLACVSAIVAVLALLWASNGFSTGSLSGHGIAAIVLGVTFSVALAVALMALVFYSNRSGQDDQAHRSDKQ